MKNFGFKKISSIIFFTVVSLFFIPFSYIIPKRKGFYLFGSGRGFSFSGNPKYLFLSQYNNNFLFLTKSKKIEQSLKNKKYNCINFSKHYLLNFWILLRAERIFIDKGITAVSPFNMLLGNFKFIQLWHGTPIKKIGLNNIKYQNFLIEIMFKFVSYLFSKNIELVTCTNESSKKIFKKALLSKNVFVTGYSRNDIFFDRSLIFEDINKKLSLYNYKNVFLYAPTFRDDNSTVFLFSDPFLSILNKYLKKNKSILLISSHPLQTIIFNSNFSNIKNVSKEIEDIQELLIYTDVLITDYSSSLFDFSLTNKPIIFYPYDYENYLKNCRGLYYDYFNEFPGPFARNEKELFNAIKNIKYLSKRKEYKKKYEKFKRKFNKYLDGNSSRRILIQVGLKK